MANIVTRNVLVDGSCAIYECLKSNAKARVILQDGRLERVAHYEEGLSDRECVDAVNAFLADEHVNFIAWAARRSLALDPVQLAAPLPIA